MLFLSKLSAGAYQRRRQTLSHIDLKPSACMTNTFQLSCLLSYTKDTTHVTTLDDGIWRANANLSNVIIIK